MKTPMRSVSSLLLALIAAAAPLRAEIPTVLTDKIHRGSGVIDLLKDMKGSQLAEYLKANGNIFLAADINENASGNENARSMGVALQEMRLLLTTTSGDFSFSDFYTSTSAKILAAGATSAQEFSTLFGQSGSNELTSATRGFDISNFDDVITISNINFTGDILSARLEVAFLNVDTGKNAAANEQFFDFSGGFEDFAILTKQEAAVLEAAAIGQAAAPAGVVFAQNTTPLTPVTPPDNGGATPVDPGTGGTGDTSPTTPDTGGGATNPGTGGIADTGGTGTVSPVPSAPGAPAPPLILLLAGAALLAFQQWRARQSNLAA